ncbi:MAG TPA: tagaturonate epimerase family protein [Bacteroidota bacterium]|nr:tagaturonate epimerase family protein [Bacteroidota bacterium]
MELEKYSLGIGDRFGAEGVAQLRALQQAKAQSVDIVPVWNKSNREHTIIGTLPDDTRREADDAVRACGWKDSYYVDADHIGLKTVERFLASSNFFTIDVADYIGKPTSPAAMTGFVKEMAQFKGKLQIPHMPSPVAVTDELLIAISEKYLFAIEEAGNVYREIASKKGAGSFVTEVSVDEASSPQTPAELFFILAAIAREGIPIQTIAPKFTGSFLKGIDYVGDCGKFAREFEDDLAVIAFAVKTFDLPKNLKLSVHSGSDKFSLYPIIHAAIRKNHAGLHVKTAGTTWLEELIGLAAAGGEGLKLAKEIYASAYARYDELCQPYLSVISIDRSKLPDPKTVNAWSGAEYVQTLQHNQACKSYSIHFRQLVHVGYKVAAEMGERYTKLLKECRAEIERNVTTNIYDRHIRPLFLGQSAGVQMPPSKKSQAASVAM